jgi:hypothetical protein
VVPKTSSLEERTINVSTPTGGENGPTRMKLSEMRKLEKLSLLLLNQLRVVKLNLIDLLVESNKNGKFSILTKLLKTELLVLMRNLVFILTETSTSDQDFQ